MRCLPLLAVLAGLLAWHAGGRAFGVALFDLAGDASALATISRSLLPGSAIGMPLGVATGCARVLVLALPKGLEQSARRPAPWREA